MKKSSDLQPKTNRQVTSEDVEHRLKMLDQSTQAHHSLVDRATIYVSNMTRLYREGLREQVQEFEEAFNELG